MPRQTTFAKPNETERQWHLVDAQGQVLGRLASRIATILQGKHRPQYTPFVDTGDFVVVVNAAEIVMTGRKAEQKYHLTYSGYPGGQKAISYGQMLKRHPERVIELAVKRMLPKTKLGRAMFKKLKVYAGPEHDHAAQKPQPLELVKS
ncbi:MAG: 50S ribosomal protein L13 [Phycisphaeraceae bacterium]|nr:50S ribosomal protein L13 [Phycisphaeraceae bacterium]